MVLISAGEAIDFPLEETKHEITTQLVDSGSSTASSDQIICLSEGKTAHLVVPLCSQEGTNTKNKTAT